MKRGHMYEITSESLEWAYKKLKSYYYYYKGSNYIKDKIIKFEKNLNNDGSLFNEMAFSLNFEADFKNLPGSGLLDYVVYPKKNAFVQNNGKIKIGKYNTFIDLPLEYYLVDVLFCLNIIEAAGRKISGFAFIPSSDFERTADLLHNKLVFDYYRNGYKSWINIPSNSYLNDLYSSRVVVKMDLKECFYNTYFDFEKLVDDLDIKNNVSLIMSSVYQSYSEKILGDKYGKEEVTDYSILPVGLLSSNVLLNYLLSDFDKEISNLKDVISYGRYVDDIYIILKADKTYAYDEIVHRYLAGKIVYKDDTYSIKAFGRLKKDLPVNESKISIRYLDKNNHPDINWKNFEMASFIEDIEIPEMDDAAIKIDDSDIKYTRSIIKKYNPHDYEKIRRAFFNMTSCDLLNSHGLWMDIFKIIRENKDKNTLSALKDRIKSSFNLISCYTDDVYDSSMTKKMVKQLNYELNFSVRYCNCKSSSAAYLFNIKDSDVFGLLDRAIKENDDRLPFNASIADLSLYYSQCNKCLDSEIQSFVIENYKNLNGFVDISDFKITKCILNEEGGLLRLKNGANDYDKVRICISCIPLQHFDDAKQYVRNYGKLSKLSAFEIDKIIQEASKNKCDYIVFSEFSMNVSLIRHAVSLCRKNHISLICGIDHFNEGNQTYNLCCLFDRNTNLVFFKPKNYLPLMEKIITQKAGHDSYEPDKKKYLIVEDGNFSYSLMTCYEATNIIDRALLAGKINCLFLPVYNKDTKYFSNIVESFSRDASSYVVQANCNGYGDSRIRMPSRDVQADVIRTKGGENFYCIVGELDIEKLKQCNEKYLNAYRNCSEYGNRDIKPLSAGNVHYER